MKKLPQILTSIVIIVLICLMSVFDIFGYAEWYYEDLLFKKEKAVPADIKIIAIDEPALAKLGPYSSWNRGIFADVLDILYSGETKPMAVGLDVVFSGNSTPEEDQKLVEAVKGRNIILASKFNTSTRIDYSSKSYEYYVSSQDIAFDELNEVSTSGITNAILDGDGYLRRTYTTIYSDNTGYDSFAVALLKKTGYSLPDYPSKVEFLYTGNPGDFEVISMADVLDGNVPSSHFEDSIVLIGAYEDGMLDSYSVPIKHNNPMYGVEIQANAIDALRNGRVVNSVPNILKLLTIIIFLTGFALLAYRFKVGKNSIFLGIFLGAYAVLCVILFEAFSVKSQLLYIPLGLILMYLAALVVRYVESQKMLAAEMKQTLFSMADSMAEAIEGRTPYNANHTKNVAKRSVEMLKFINELHKQGKSEYYFSNNDIDQMYLAAMLHDIGKMDVPLEVMDKPTKLGNKEDKLKDRLEIIKLHISNDILTGEITKESGEKCIEAIDSFVNKLGLFNCGKPLSDEEKNQIISLSEMKYTNKDGNEIPYLTEEELDDLMIKAGTLSEKERTIMQSHVVYTNKILSHVHFGESFNKVNEMASNHHELLNGKGYPNGIGEKELDVMTRILTIMDIYDSLIADDRPYKKPKTVKVAFEILNEEAAAGKVDKDLLEIAKEIYLKGAEE